MEIGTAGHWGRPSQILTQIVWGKTRYSSKNTIKKVKKHVSGCLCFEIGRHHQRNDEELRKQNWRNDIRCGKQVEFPFLSKMMYTESERIELKKEFLRMLVRLEWDEASDTGMAGGNEVVAAWRQAHEAAAGTIQTDGGLREKGRHVG